MSDTFTSHISTWKTHFAPKIKVVPSAKPPKTLISTQEPADPSEAIRSSQTQISCFQMENKSMHQSKFLKKVIELKLHTCSVCHSLKLCIIYQYI